MTTYGEGSEIYQKLDLVEVSVYSAVTQQTVILPHILDVNIDLEKNEPMKWKIELDNSEGEFSLYNTAGTYNQYIKPIGSNRWSIRIKSGSEDKTWTYLTAIDYSTDAGSGIVNISGVDGSWKLYQENQTMPTWRSGPSGIIMAKTIIQAICTKFDIAYNLSEFTDYMVRWLHLQGEIPMDIIKDILTIRWAEWYMDGNTLYVKQPTIKIPPTPEDYTIDDDKTLESLSYGIGRWSVYTEIIVRRAAESSGILFDEQGTTGQEHKINFNSPYDTTGAINVIIDQVCVNGVINEVHLFSAADGGGTEADYAGYGGGTAWKCVGFFFQPTDPLPAGSSTPSYHIRGRGDSPVENDAMDRDFAVRFRNNALASWLGEARPAPDPIINSLIPSIAIAKEYAIRYLQESARALEKVSGTIGLHILLKPSDTIAIKESNSYFAGDDATSRFYVEKVSHSIASMGTTITAKRYRTETYTADADPGLTHIVQLTIVKPVYPYI
jgi:hypothetical protein